MTLGIIQGAATVKFGLTASTTDVSTDVHSCVLKVSFDEVTRKATFGDPFNKTYAGGINREIALSFADDGAYSGSTLGAMINNIAFNAALAATPSTPILYFDLVFDNATVAAANKRYTGTVSVLEAQRGGTVAELRERTLTLPVISWVEATS